MKGKQVIRRRRNGRLERVKRPDAAGNSRPKKVHILTGSQSRALLYGALDRRTQAGKQHVRQCAALAAHVGGDPTAAQLRLIDQAARLHLLGQMAWAELLRAGALVKKGRLAPAFEAYVKAARDERATLQLLGLERKARNVTLQDVLRSAQPPADPEPEHDDG